MKSERDLRRLVSRNMPGGWFYWFIEPRDEGGSSPGFPDLVILPPPNLSRFPIFLELKFLRDDKRRLERVTIRKTQKRTMKIMRRCRQRMLFLIAYADTDVLDLCGYNDKLELGSLWSGNIDGLFDTLMK